MGQRWLAGDFLGQETLQGNGLIACARAGRWLDGWQAGGEAEAYPISRRSQQGGGGTGRCGCLICRLA
ncbi:MAG: hypothetical protein KDE04_18220 [Anaerolineales bacterium]|nr:hypothetical protein [Anaerolineales bacterium]